MSIKATKKRLPEAWHNCVTNDGAARERGKRISFEAKKGSKARATRIKIDNCLPLSGKRCDFAFYVEQTKTFWFVELKGTDVTEAFEQLTSTIPQFAAQVAPPIKPSEIIGKIVCSNVPKHSRQKLRKQVIEFRKYGRKLEVDQLRATVAI